MEDNWVLKNLVEWDLVEEKDLKENGEFTNV